MSKSDGVADIVKWMEAQIKEQKKRLDEANSKHSCIQEVGDFFDACKREEAVRMETMVSWKISTEKYMKKLRHEGN